MKYDPKQHHRRSLRLPGHDYTSSGAYFITICSHQRQCLFGEIVEGEMRLSKYGQIVRSYWLNLPKYHPRLQLDAFVVMPNHIHGILVLSDIPVGAVLNEDIVDLTQDLLAKPVHHPKHNFHPNQTGLHPQSSVGAGLNDELVDLTDELSAKPAPTNPSEPTHHHGIPEIIRGFKTFSARRINQRRKMAGTPVWQRNYYEHIIRDESSLNRLRQYIHNNPLSWQEDQLHPDVRSKW